MKSWCVFVPLIGTSPFGVGFDGSEFNPIHDSSGSDIFIALLISLASADESGISGVLMRS